MLRAHSPSDIYERGAELRLVLALAICTSACAASLPTFLGTVYTHTNNNRRRDDAKSEKKKKGEKEKEEEEEEEEEETGVADNNDNDDQRDPLVSYLDFA